MNAENRFEFSQSHQEKIERVKRKAEDGDVTFELNRWFGEKMKQADPELLEIQRHGFASEAISWLRSMTPDGMKYGTTTREERLAGARESAEKAQTTIEELAEQNGIDLQQ